jgi:hypothetical protein
MDIKSIVKEFGEYYQTNVTTDSLILAEPREEKFRVSGFPYCGLRHLYRRISTQKPEFKEFGEEYYTGVGTLTHEIIQEYLGLRGRMYGAWKCEVRKCKGVREFSKNSKCPLCGARMRYVEFEVKAFNNLSGHLDGVYKSKSGHWFVVDYKTSSVKTISRQKYERTLPYAYNVAQIVAYCSLIELLLDIEISGWMLHYLARDSPMLIHHTCGGLVTTRSKRLQMKKMELWDNHYSLVMDTNKSFKNVQTLIDQKPCQTYEQYSKEYKTFNECPLSCGHVCFDKKKLSNVVKLTFEEHRSKNVK